LAFPSPLLHSLNELLGRFFWGPEVGVQLGGILNGYNALSVGHRLEVDMSQGGGFLPAWTAWGMLSLRGHGEPAFRWRIFIPTIPFYRPWFLRLTSGWQSWPTVDMRNLYLRFPNRAIESPSPR
jgi:hypothetical protein